MDKLKEIEAELQETVKNLSKDHYGPIPAYPLKAMALMLKLCQEMIKMRREFVGEPKDWGRMHT